MESNAQDGVSGILDGIRIIDMSTGIAGPVATMLLAEVGADVVKVELPRPGPDREEPGFRTWNRSKRSVALDLATDDGRAELEQLLAAADVLVHRARAHSGQSGRPRRCWPGCQAPEPDRLVGAVVASQPSRRRPAGRRDLGHGPSRHLR